MPTYTSSTSNGFQLLLELTPQAYSIPNNSTPVKWVLKLKIGSSYFVDYRTMRGVTINGSSVYSADNQFNCSGANTTMKLAEGTTTINHNNDGTKTISFSTYFETNTKDAFTPQVKLTISGSLTLTTIPRYAQITEFKSNGMSYDETVIGYATDVPVSKVELSTNGGSWIDITSGLHSTKKRGTRSNTGLTPNTTYNYKIRVTRQDSGLVTESTNTVSIRTRKLTTITSVNSNLDTTSKSITVTHEGVDMKILCQAQNNDGAWVTFRDTGIVKTNVTSLSFTQAQIDTVLNSKTNGKTVSIRFRVTSVWFGVDKGTTTSPTYTYNIVGVSPSISGITYVDPSTNTELQNLKGGNQIILQGVSDCKVTIGQANAYKGATISSYRISYFEKSYTFNGNNQASQSNATYTISRPQAINASTLIATVTDSRGFTAQTSIIVQAKPYELPQILIANANRQNGYETNTRLVGNGRVHMVMTNNVNQNTQSARWRWKERLPSSTWSAYANLGFVGDGTEGNWLKVKWDVYARDFDINKEYDIEIGIWDKISGYATSTQIVLRKGIALLEFYENKIEIGKPLHALHTSVNPNFNADMVDGLHASSFIQKSIYIPPNDNLNNYKTEGLYHNHLNDETATIGNTPINNAFSLQVLRHASGSVRQIFREYRLNLPNTWERNFYNGSWGAWTRVITGINLTEYMQDYIINSSSSHIRFVNGNLIQWGTYTGRLTKIGAFGNWFSYFVQNSPNFNFPFVGVPSVKSTVASSGTYIELAQNPPTNIHVGAKKVIHQSDYPDPNTSPSVTVYWEAKGRWK